MRTLVIGLLLALCGAASPAGAQVLRLTDLNAAQLRALDRSKTMVLLTGGMLEEHGPYLPAYTDGILSDRLTQEIAQAVIANKPGWTVLLFPQIPFGTSGSNEIGGRFSFPGTYAVRPSTLRAVFMDLASELGDQGFRWIMVVHVHGAPLHIRAIDDAGDFFHDTYGGRMINLWDLLPVISGWGNAMVSAMTDAEKKEDGASLHGGMDEHSLILYLKPELVAPGYRTAPAVTGQSLQESFDEARKADWPGYLGSPRLATAALGEKIWVAFSAAASDQTLKILEGIDSSAIPRYADILEKNPIYQKEWISPAAAHDEALDAKEREWLRRRQR
jgi:creatinine amidohydrolase/Fe(II)-dependent formamide hydrolase-like protein